MKIKSSVVMKQQKHFSYGY